MALTLKIRETSWNEPRWKKPIKTTTYKETTHTLWVREFTSYYNKIGGRGVRGEESLGGYWREVKVQQAVFPCLNPEKRGGGFIKETWAEREGVSRTAPGHSNSQKSWTKKKSVSAKSQEKGKGVFFAESSAGSEKADLPVGDPNEKFGRRLSSNGGGKQGKNKRSQWRVIGNQKGGKPPDRKSLGKDV